MDIRTLVVTDATVRCIMNHKKKQAKGHKLQCQMSLQPTGQQQNLKPS